MSFDVPPFHFEILKRSGRARLGKLTTPHGVVETPAFVFCATKAALRVALPWDVRALGAQIVLGNTYHLYLRPGSDVIARAGGLHRFMGWKRPMLTDSGGFQIFSMGYGGVIDEIKGTARGKQRSFLQEVESDGARFTSYVDGSTHLLSPEKSIDVQMALGADLIFALDVCTPYHASRAETTAMTELSHRWETRSLQRFLKCGKQGSAGPQALYGIVQGGVYEDLRKASATYVSEQPFFGQAIGGSLGATPEEMQGVVEICMPHLPENRPTHLLGIGNFSQILHAVSHGVDTFDCVLPTRLARHGWALIDSNKRMNLKNAVHRYAYTPVDPLCDCPICRGGSITQSYLHYLFRTGETLGGVLLSLHNIRFFTRFFAELRRALSNNSFNDFFSSQRVPTHNP